MKNNSTPMLSRPHVSIFGETNAGKSSLFNAILGQETAIVSDIAGTTTDPVIKGMELIPYGPVVLTDTAGINDQGALGGDRAAKTRSILERTDLAIYLIDKSGFNEASYKIWTEAFEKRGIPFITVITKGDTSVTDERVSEAFHDALVVSVKDKNTVNDLKEKISAELAAADKKNEDENNSFIGDLIPEGGVAVMVVPTDSEAPKGRIILPQVQFIRDCLDHSIRCVVTNESQLAAALSDSATVSIVVTDSQVFKYVSSIVPENIPLTSFSILTARQKCGLDELYNGALHIGGLKDGDRVLIAESCTHNHTHEDIGRVKIPATLKRATGKELRYEFTGGRDFPENLSVYALIVHCGGCMTTRREMKNRVLSAQACNTPFTNYGMVLAYGNGILERSMELFKPLLTLQREINN